MQRDQWGNRAAFILAAVGSAAGLGNAWRFPYVVFKNGGGAYLIPYFVALLTAGIPLIIMEFALGQKHQQGAPGSLAKIKDKFEFFGWWPVISAFVIVSYYAGVMGWAWNYVADAFTGAWIGANTQDYFYNNVLKISSGPSELGGFSFSVLVGVVLTWILIYFILRNGTESVGKVVWFTVLSPIVLLLILIFRSVTLPGAIAGINYYLQPDFSVLTNFRVWIDAYSQVFFTLSLGMGIMIAYASYMPEDSDIINNALITVFANSGVSFMSGFAIFGTLGYMAQNQGVPIDEVATAGVGLAFVTYPNAINMLPGGPIVVGFFGIVFFVTLLTLGIDSAFSLVESNVAGFSDKFNWEKRKITLTVISLLFIAGLVFSTKAGLYWLDIVDHYINNYGLIVGGILETIAVGWYYKPDKLRNYFNPISEYKFGSWWNIMIKFVVPIVLIFLLIRNLIADINTPYGGYSMGPQWIGGWGMIIGVGVVSYFLSQTTSTKLDASDISDKNIGGE